MTLKRELDVLRPHLGEQIGLILKTDVQQAGAKGAFDSPPLGLELRRSGLDERRKERQRVSAFRVHENMHECGQVVPARTDDIRLVAIHHSLPECRDAECDMPRLITDDPYEALPQVRKAVEVLEQ